ncbi:MAG: hypothetical protein Tsb0021_10020 [Chlamydiales bacterium]
MVDPVHSNRENNSIPDSPISRKNSFIENNKINSLGEKINIQTQSSHSLVGRVKKFFSKTKFPNLTRLFFKKQNDIQNDITEIIKIDRGVDLYYQILDLRKEKKEEIGEEKIDDILKELKNAIPSLKQEKSKIFQKSNYNKFILELINKNKIELSEIEFFLNIESFKDLNKLAENNIDLFRLVGKFQFERLVKNAIDVNKDYIKLMYHFVSESIYDDNELEKNLKFLIGMGVSFELDFLKPNENDEESSEKFTSNLEKLTFTLLRMQFSTSVELFYLSDSVVSKLFSSYMKNLLNSITELKKYQNNHEMELQIANKKLEKITKTAHRSKKFERKRLVLESAIERLNDANDRVNEGLKEKRVLIENLINEIKSHLIEAEIQTFFSKVLIPHLTAGEEEEFKAIFIAE